MKKNKKKFKNYFKKRLKNNGINILKYIFIVLFLLSILLFIEFFILYIKIIYPLPDVKNLKEIKMPEASIIYDRNGKELYKIYDENRVYIKYSEINKNMINAIVAGEDKRFWNNSGYDFIGITRAILDGLKNGGHFSGTSTISQQLAKMIYLNNKRTLERKLKELYLSIKLTSNFNKEDILEVYLNKVFFGGNSYGVQTASQTFFGVDARDLDILQSSILASLPKAPTGLSPYVHKDKLLGYPLIFDKINDKVVNYKGLKILSKDLFYKNRETINLLISTIKNINLKKEGDLLEICDFDSKIINPTSKFSFTDGCILIEYSELLNFLNSIHIETDSKIIEYKTGRKDYILGRMLEDGYISIDEYKDAIIESFGLDFKKYKDRIKYPYFVMYVKDFLVKKYGENILEKGGYKIYTTIDPVKQEKAEEIIRKYISVFSEKHNAKNAALISVDSKNGEILTFVGGKDYWDTNNGGFNNMLLSRLQPGSTIKPFVYALAMIKNHFWWGTYITDNKVTFPGGYSPHNADGGYMGRMTLSKALNYSRNIPAIKLFYAAGGEKNLTDFLGKLGMKNVSLFKHQYFEKYGVKYNYGPPMALGTIQITPLELTQAFQVFANKGYKIKLIPILRIIDSDGRIVDDFTKNKSLIKVLDSEVAISINKILSNQRDRPKYWNDFLQIPGREISAKTGTSTIEYYSKKWTKDSKGRWYRKKIIIPRNLWTVGYTPQFTTVVWVGNTNGEGIKGELYGINGAGPIMRDFMTFVHNGLEIINW